jgi:hypothetical protein
MTFVQRFGGLVNLNAGRPYRPGDEETRHVAQS